MKKNRIIVARILMAWTLIVSILLPQHVEAATPTGAIYYCVTGGEGHYCDTLDTAFQACREDGGVIWIYEDREINFPDYIQSGYGYLNENTRLTIDQGVVLTIGEYGFRMDGVLQIIGTVDMEHSDGILYGDGTVQLLGDGDLIKRSYEVDDVGNDMCLEANNISYGQKLSEAVIPSDKIYWRTDVEGEWSFKEPDCVPQAGTNKFDIVYTPTYPMTYDPLVYKQSGVVTVDQTVPERQDYTMLEIHAGENLLEVKPEITYISPVTGEEVAGKFVFDQSEVGVSQLGEQELLGTFIPTDANYSQVTEYLKVKVCVTTPKVSVMPTIRTQAVSGQTLDQIGYVSGKCVNPYNQKVVEGSWEWKDESCEIKEGTHDYSMLFIPDEQGYETVEVTITLTATEKDLSAGTSTDGEDNDSEDDEVSPYVITQVISKTTAIKTNVVTVTRTSWRQVKRNGARLKLSWKKVSGVKYQIQYGKKKNFKKCKSKTTSKTNLVLKKLSKKKKYYVRIRCVKTIDGKNYYSSWSAKKRA